MCGIAGIFNLNGKPVAFDQIKAMTDSIAHRGPDGEGQFTDKYIGLGHRRLAIIDLSPAGHQPMQTKDGRYLITYNGEVYNFKILRKELETLGYSFFSNTDTEVVLNAYVQWGEKCLEKFNGMFAFAVWDRKEKTLFLARDRYGIKPLYYYQTNDCFVFASEIKAIIASGLYGAEINKEALVEYLTFQNFFTDRTLFKDVRIMPAGHFMMVKRENSSLHQYWDFNFTNDSALSEKMLLEKINDLFQQAVNRQLVSDVPVNSYLSGGVDSGSITMIAAKQLPHIRTFTVGFDLSSASGLELAFDERQAAEHLSYLAGTEHYEMVLKAGDMERCMQDLVWHLEEPRIGQSYPNFYAAKLASKFGKVVLAGTGGDELYAGYPWRYLCGQSSENFEDYIDKYYQYWQRLMSNKNLFKVLAPIAEEVKSIWTRDIFANVFRIKDTPIKTEDYINYSLYFEAKTFLHGLLVVEDKLSMAHGLETRVPCLDNDFVDFALQVPVKYKLSDFAFERVNENDTFSKREKRMNGKKILRKMMSRYVPDNVAHAPKQGFSAPDASWFKGESIEFVRSLLGDRNAKIFELLDYSVVNHLVNDHIQNHHNHRLLIWSLIYLEIFMQVHLSKGHKSNYHLFTPETVEL
ncbi:asparagine synthase (glutamine-hydrolyzing) [Coxiella burnetii]|uniref:asparagine synthase (glutamine-hydrolyzing) n=1 Tax=Coxiella burnetii (strain RSA 493 / Nine Mile phase I) TaxID=227377 RepID=Q83DA7_COXBU|nr:asparagine synthase (glutamine-hydrolyzing) [Coxiella burnetii]NP_819851.1 asparagine synthetase (glutamine-hydrolyzing) [Coxiella burnetii RSA 493]AAO90365.1 asparagine synthetase (glutamine-hydrolyzing) [Coxiella burnetii RSA 493]ARI65664.1 asparagine synthetase B [Coxiella burnetii]ARK27140.1 asparagine synthase (glutamine-hydrolyzing) [Coxiella burnetii]ATN74261.1 asparagine synthetase B [Coxiella burnetii]ATN76167.1 asparagine synthetase B [Coxiella burnetii]